MRDELLSEIQSQVDIDPDIPPVVSLDDYFSGNTDEWCIAPNQVGDGRPSLADLYDRFRQIQSKPEVQCVLVGIHGDWAEARKYPDQWPAAENVHIYTTASVAEVGSWIAGLASDGAGVGWPYGMHPSAPALNPGFNVITVFWD